MAVKDAARLLQVSSAFWSAVENDKRRLSRERLDDACELLDVEDAERRTLAALWGQARLPGWWQEYSDLFDPEGLRFFGLEDGATHVRCYESTVVTGLFQIESYSLELISSHPGNSPASYARRLEVRRQRQSRLWEVDPPQISTILSETCLHQVVGTPQTLLEQLKHLLFLTSELRGSLQLRILPFSQPPRGASSAATLILLSFQDQDLLPTIGFHEAMTSGDMNIDSSALLELVFNQAMEVALDPASSIGLIQSRIEAMERDLRR